MLYFIGRDGKQMGPFTEPQVRERLEAKQIGLDDLIWHEGMAGWQPVRNLFQEVADQPAGATPDFRPPPFSHGAFRSDVTREAAPAEPALASRNKRLVATSLDHMAAIVCAIPGLFQLFKAVFALQQSGGTPDEAAIMRIMISGIALFAVPLGILGLVQLVLLATRAQTIGKILCKIRIVRTNGEPAGFVHTVLLRGFVMGLISSIPVVGVFILLIDPLLIFREDRRCIHDLVAGTTVVDA